MMPLLSYFRIFFIFSFFFFLAVCVDPLQPTTEINNGLTIKPTATTGMVIDAGSGGSRLHIFTWKPRIFKTVPPPLSYPEANEKYTARIDPGIHNFANDLSKIADHLAPLIDFAKIALVGSEKTFGDFPIYFKATGGVRELDVNNRERVLGEVRRLLSDKSFCPFFFRDDFARVISGEEEAIFSWTATNFLMGTLLPNSEGLGEVLDVNSTYGTLDLGGASTQIAFFVPSQDILEGLYKLQIGGQKMWNVYAKSFLQFGVVSARLRHIQQLINNLLANSPTGDLNTNHVINYCFHSGYSETVQDEENNLGRSLEVTGPNQPLNNQLNKCRESLLPLMQKELGKLCQQVYHGDCSIGGAYQPPIPKGKHGHFIGQSSYKYPWAFLLLPKTATLQTFEEKASDLCRMTFSEMMLYYESHNINLGGSDKVTDYLPYYCFLSGYMLTLLEDGYRFQKNQTLTVLDEVNGHRVGWALGAILYEINELPWILKLSAMETHPYGFVALASVIGFILGIVASYFVYREIVDDKKVLPGSANNSEKRRLYAEEDNFEEIRRLNTIDLIRSKQATTFTASTDFVPMNVSTGTKLTSEGSNGRGGGGGDWMGKWTNGGKSQNGHYQDIR